MADALDVTQLLHAYSGGNRDAFDDLFAQVYDELRRLARYHLRQERSNHTLSTTALVHEAYIKLVRQENAQWQNRAHFYAVASQAMRRLLISHARKRNAQKRGGDVARVTLNEHLVEGAMQDDQLLALDEALSRLEQLSPRQSRVVECRFFGGLSVEETAAALSISEATVKRDWRVAKAWLYRELQESDG
ncbi:MAG: sigma-70 family RNA polymerase sigma factor [Bacteroidota bacterium]